MTVKDVLKSASNMVGRQDVYAYLDGSISDVGEDTLPAIGVMTNLLNLVVGELAGTFIPMVKSEEVSAEKGKIYFNSLSERCVRIISLLDRQGREISYVHTPEYMEVSSDFAVVEYEYIPPNYGLEDQIGYDQSQVSVGTLAYGLCAEYAISKGSFDEAVMWHDRYVQSVSERRKLKNGQIKKRSFV